ncbi:MAG: hypothetical protein BGO39_37250 [Chloroflexi bacterium 54-19]|nr:MAG: hypothetical protein BGO39_37250 [Chloroflexi bacterium 54-19]
MYVEEVDRGSKPIEGVGTSVAAFVGFTEKGPREAQLITNWEQFRTIYGGFIEGAFLPTSVYGYFLNGGTRAYVMRVAPAIQLPQTRGSKNALEFTPLLTAGDEAVSVKVDNGAVAGRYKLTISQGDVTETFDDLSSDKKDPAARYVENIVNDPAKGSKLVRVYDSSGTRELPEARAPKSGNYAFGDAKPAAELPPPALRLNPRNAGDQPAVEIRQAPGVTKPVSVEVLDVQGKDDLFRLVFKAGDESETHDVSFAKGATNLETVINGGKTASKLVRVKDLDEASKANPADRRPAAGKFELSGISAPAAGSKGKVSFSTADITGDSVDRTGVGGLEALDDVTMVIVPDLMTLYLNGTIDLKGVQVVQTAIMNHCEAMKNRVAILDAPPDMNAQQIRNWRMNEANYDSQYAALYYPWIEIDNPAQKGKTMFSPPSGHMAGIWARSDAERGVHKAPANEIVRGAVGLERNITMGEQDGLNPNGINCIRAFPGRGIRVWGARTLSSDPSWRYINVRRLFNFVEASIKNGTQWVVFEPNDFDLWARIRRDINAFLYSVYLTGAFFGLSPDQAYFVKCDAEINPPETIDQGIVVTEIGFAPVKPAEFVVFRVGQMAAGGA